MGCYPRLPYVSLLCCVGTRGGDDFRGDVPAFDLHNGIGGGGVGAQAGQGGGLTGDKLDPVVGPEDGGDESAGGRAKGGSDLEGQDGGAIVEMQAQFAAARSGLDLRVDCNF